MSHDCLSHYLQLALVMRNERIFDVLRRGSVDLEDAKLIILLSVS